MNDWQATEAAKAIARQLWDSGKLGEGARLSMTELIAIIKAELLQRFGNN